MQRVQFGICPALLGIVLWSITVLTGCSSVPHGSGTAPIDRLPPVYETMPRELCKVVLPEYRVEPPDILMIEGIKIVPKSRTELRTADVLHIEIDPSTTLPEAPVSGDYPVEPGGIVNLGEPYGKVEVTGLSVDDAKEATLTRLQNHLKSPEIQAFYLGQIAPPQQILGQFLVGVDGTVTLGSYGSVSVVGMTLNEAKQAIESHLSKFLDDPEVSLNVFAYNSKVYYIVVQGAGLGDGVYRLPITGNETVLDAIGQIQGLEQVSSKKMWIARPSRSCSNVKILPIDWHAITQEACTATNYQVLPGDRVFVAEDKWIAWDTQIAKLTAPLERIMGFSLLGVGAVTRFSGPVLQGGGNRRNLGL